MEVPLHLASGWSDEERVSQGDGQPRVNDKSPTIDNDVQDSLLVVSTSATDVETLRITKRVCMMTRKRKPNRHGHGVTESCAMRMAVCIIAMRVS